MQPQLYTLHLDHGTLSISSRPRGGDWLRDELIGLRDAGVDVLVSALTLPEEEELDLGEERHIAEVSGLEFVRLSIPDRDVPTVLEARQTMAHLHEALQRGKHVAIHCRLGIGRSALIVASLLILDGRAPQDALEEIQAVRGVPVPDTERQRAWIQDFAQAL
jgi:protein-tyrosine phosphatase